MGNFSSVSTNDLEYYPDGLKILLKQYKMGQTLNDDRFGRKVTLYSKLSDPQQQIVVQSSWSLSPEEDQESNKRMDFPNHLEKARLVHSRCDVEHPRIAQ